MNIEGHADRDMPLKAPRIMNFSRKFEDESDLVFCSGSAHKILRYSLTMSRPLPEVSCVEKYGENVEHCGEQR